MDTFDCVTPTREARHGRVLMKGAPKGFINILNSQYKDDPRSALMKLWGCIPLVIIQNPISITCSKWEMLAFKLCQST